MNKTCFKITLFISLFTLIGINGYAAKTDNYSVTRTLAKKSELMPLGRNQITTINTRDRKNHYYLIGSGEELHYQIMGPGMLRIISRYHFDKNSMEIGKYKVNILDNQSMIDQVMKESQPSKVSQYADNNSYVPGKIRNIWSRIPEGVHSVKLALPKNETYKVNFKLLFETLPNAYDLWSLQEPDKFLRKDTLNIAGQSRTYYPLYDDEKLTFSAQGPAHLRLITRWHGSGAKSIKRNYSIHVLQDERPYLEQYYVSGLATKVEYEENTSKENLFGISKKLYIQVPNGKHDYEIRFKGEENVSAVFIRPFMYTGDVDRLGEIQINHK